ncbi:hypothetical protein [Aeromonas allosaccharophila]|uniref:hypothetical protein n=1 Tax=Aeromonas allosaccharophila TaxID=656 RepID=UPI003D231C2E
MSGHSGLWPKGRSDGYKGRGRNGSRFIPGLSGQKYQDGEIRGLSRGKNGAEGYQGFINMAAYLDANLLFLNGFYQK